MELEPEFFLKGVDPYDMSDGVLKYILDTLENQHKKTMNAIPRTYNNLKELLCEIGFAESIIEAHFRSIRPLKSLWRTSRQHSFARRRILCYCPISRLPMLICAQSIEIGVTLGKSDGYTGWRIPQTGSLLVKQVTPSPPIRLY